MSATRDRSADEHGFSLVELMVVVLIIGVLLAVGIPTFVGAQQRSGNRAAQADLRNGVTAAKVVANDGDGSMVDVTPATLAAEEGSITFATAGSGAAVGVVKSTGDSPAGSTAVLLYTEAASGTWFGVVTTERGAISYCSGPGADAVDDIATCGDDAW